MIRAHEVAQAMRELLRLTDQRRASAYPRLPTPTQRDADNWRDTQEHLGEAVNFALPETFWLPSSNYRRVAEEFGRSLHENGIWPMPYPTVWFNFDSHRDDGQGVFTFSLLIRHVAAEDLLPAESLRSLRLEKMFAFEFTLFDRDDQRGPSYSVPFAYSAAILGLHRDADGETRLMIVPLAFDLCRFLCASAQALEPSDVLLSKRSQEDLLYRVVTALQTFVGLLACKGVQVDTRKPPMLLNQSRKAKGKYLINTTCTVTIPADGLRREGTGGLDRHRKSPVPHPRRGHVRVYHRGTEDEFAVAFPPTFVMATDNVKAAVKAKDYNVK